MTVAKVMKLTDQGVREAMRHPVLKGKKIIGRGVFSIVFEGTRKNAVLKLTCDQYAYRMLNDDHCAVTHRHFPRVSKNYSRVGNVKLAGRDFPIYLYEMERLEELQFGTEQRKLALKLCKSVDLSDWKTASTMSRIQTALALEDAAKDKNMPRSIKNALMDLGRFCRAMPGAGLDLHMGNIMRRKNGEIVFTDPQLDPQCFASKQW